MKLQQQHLLRAGSGAPSSSGARGARARGERGTTILELMVVLTIMLVAVSIFYQMVGSTRRLQEVNHENAVAAEAARAIVERLRNEEFTQVFVLYNQDPDDDPDGSGTAPGPRFEVDGLEPLAGQPLVGEVAFPEYWVEVVEEEESGTLSGGGGFTTLGGGGSTTTTTSYWEWQLREDFEDEELGLPRDLNGDNILDDLDHADDYLILPVRIRLEWQGVAGTRRFELFTMLCDVRRT